MFSQFLGSYVDHEVKHGLAHFLVKRVVCIVLRNTDIFELVILKCPLVFADKNIDRSQVLQKVFMPVKCKNKGFDFSATHRFGCHRERIEIFFLD